MKFRLTIVLIVAVSVLFAVPSVASAYPTGTSQQWDSLTQYVNTAPEYGRPNLTLCDTGCQQLADAMESATPESAPRAASRKLLMDLRGRLGLTRFVGWAAAGTAAFYTGWQIGTQLRENFQKTEAPAPASSAYHWVTTQTADPMIYYPNPAGVSSPAGAPFLQAYDTTNNTVRESWNCNNGGDYPVFSTPVCPAPYHWTLVYRSWTALPEAGSVFWYKPPTASQWTTGVSASVVPFDVPKDQLSKPVADQFTAAESNTGMAEKTKSEVQTKVDEQATKPELENGLDESYKYMLDQTTTTEIDPNAPPAPDAGGGVPYAPPAGGGDDPNTCQMWSRPNINLQPLNKSLGQKFPFGVPFWLYGVISQFSGSGGAPSWIVHFGSGNLHIDLASVQPAVDVIRPILLVVSMLSFVFLLASFAAGGSKD